VLAYLRTCARSVVLDAQRRRQAHLALEDAGEEASDEPSPHVHCLAREEQEALWRMVARHLRDERERRLVVLIYQTGLRPAEVHARHPELFPRVDDVYRLHRNILERLRRDGELRHCRDE
jgi:DNA-directed RNA polymerase specialized sigma24 family protein